MQLLKSFFCFQGLDNRHRFIVISSLSYLLFLFINAALWSHNILASILLLLLVLLNALTTLRRLNDAQLNRNWLAGPAISFLMIGLAIIFTTHQSLYWLLFIPGVFSALLLTYPSKTNKKYVLGYQGPVDLSEFDHSNNNNNKQFQRIEPTVMGTPSNSINTKESSVTNFQQNVLSTSNLTDTESSLEYSKSHNSGQDLGEAIRLKLFSNKNARKTVLVFISLIALAVIFSIIVNSLNITPTEKTIEKPVDAPSIRLSKITLPDNFSIMLSVHQGLIVNWQADKTTTGELWSVLSAKGEKSCKEITFNNGDKYRTTTVVVENDSDYFANFSPLDSKAILQAVAFKGSFKLCGYSFSLKGSQATLGKHPAYADKINY